MIWLLVAALFVASIALAVYAVRGLQRDPQPIDDLRAAIVELQTEIGAALLPVLERLSERLDRWRRDQ